MVPSGTIASCYSIWLPINTAVWANCLGNSNLQHQLTVLLTSCNRPVIIIDHNDTSSQYWATESYCRCGVQSVLCVATEWTVRASNRGRTKRAFSCPQRPDKPWGPPSFRLIFYWCLFTLGLNGQGVNISASLNPMPRIRMSGVIRQRPVWSFIMCVSEQITLSVQYLLHFKIARPYQ